MIRPVAAYRPGMIREHVFNAMGLGPGTLAKASRLDVQKHFNPLGSSGLYPRNMRGDGSRIASEYYDRWGHVDWMEKNLLRDKPELAREVLTNPLARQEFLEAITSAPQARAKKGYLEEWGNLGPADIATLMGDVKLTPGQELPDPIKANIYNAKFASKEAIKLLKQDRDVNILDMGTGGGKTATTAINPIPKEYRKRVNVVLVDLMEKGLADTRQKLIAAGIDPGRITTIKTNFADLDKHPDFKQFEGKMDIIISGAAIHHTSDVTPTFRVMNKALKKNGLVTFFDWGHPARAGEAQIVAPAGATVGNFGQFYELNGNKIYAPKKTAFISRGPIAGITRGQMPTEMQAVRQMDSTWMKILKYPDHVVKYQKYFDRLANAHGPNKPSEPIVFEDYLKRLVGKEKERGNFMYVEGHRLPQLYQDAAKRAGLVPKGARIHTVYPIDGNALLFHMRFRKR